MKSVVQDPRDVVHVSDPEDQASLRTELIHSLVRKPSEVLQAYRHRFLTDAEYLRKFSDRFFHVWIRTKFSNALCNKVLRHQQRGGKLIRLDFGGIYRLARFRISECDERVLVDMELWLVQHEVPDFMGNAKPLSHGWVQRVDADN